MNKTELTARINSGALDIRLAEVYGRDAVEKQRARYAAAVENFAELFGADRDMRLFSVAGRSELSGNHTDHNHGCVIAASVDLDIIAVAAKNADNTVRVKSEGFSRTDVVDIDSFAAPDKSKFGTSASLIAGMCAGLRQKGFSTGGFDAYTTSSVLKGSGLSSSAAFEDMIGNIENHFYNDGKIDNVEIAKTAQYAENEFFGKPCGLMDQVACAVGGIVAIDFADNKNPIIEKLDFDICREGFDLCIVNTGGNHADLTDDYASVPAEMKSIAAHFGKQYLRETDETEVIREIPALRAEYGDRAILRALHFFGENKRVKIQKDALVSGNLDLFFDNVIASGRSSFCYLQNVYTTKNLTEQGLSLALLLAENFLSGKRGGWRIHGGGFAGTIQAFVPKEDTAEFCRTMEAAFGEGTCIALKIRPVGAVKIL